MWLAWQWGWPDVDALIAAMSADQLTEFQAFAELHGLGPDTNDFRFARMAMIVSKGQMAVKDLIHKPYWALVQKKTTEQIVAQWEAFNARRKRK